MFREADSWIGEAERFRDARILQVRSEEAAVPSLPQSACVLIHALPLGRLGGMLNLKSQSGKLEEVRPPGSSGWNQGWNADGYALTYTADGKYTRSYSQWFRFGGVEGYDSYIVGVRPTGTGQSLKFLFAAEVMQEVRDFVSQAVAAMSAHFDLEPPYVVMISFLGIAGTHILTARNSSQEILRDSLLLPPVVCEEEMANYDELLTPLFDILYQTAGFSGAPLKITAP